MRRNGVNTTTHWRGPLGRASRGLPAVLGLAVLSATPAAQAAGSNYGLQPVARTVAAVPEATVDTKLGQAGSSAANAPAGRQAFSNTAQSAVGGTSDLGTNTSPESKDPPTANSPPSAANQAQRTDLAKARSGRTSLAPEIGSPAKAASGPLTAATTPVSAQRSTLAQAAVTDPKPPTSGAPTIDPAADKPGAKPALPAPTDIEPTADPDRPYMTADPNADFSATATRPTARPASSSTERASKDSETPDRPSHRPPIVRARNVASTAEKLSSTKTSNTGVMDAKRSTTPATPDVKKSTVESSRGARGADGAANPASSSSAPAAPAAASTTTSSSTPATGAGAVGRKDPQEVLATALNGRNGRGSGVTGGTTAATNPATPPTTKPATPPTTKPATRPATKQPTTAPPATPNTPAAKTVPPLAEARKELKDAIAAAVAKFKTDRKAAAADAAKQLHDASAAALAKFHSDPAVHAKPATPPPANPMAPPATPATTTPPTTRPATKPTTPATTKPNTPTATKPTTSPAKTPTPATGTTPSPEPATTPTTPTTTPANMPQARMELDDAIAAALAKFKTDRNASAAEAGKDFQDAIAAALAKFHQSVGAAHAKPAPPPPATKPTTPPATKPTTPPATKPTTPPATTTTTPSTPAAEFRRRANQLRAKLIAASVAYRQALLADRGDPAKRKAHAERYRTASLAALSEFRRFVESQRNPAPATKPGKTQTASPATKPTSPPATKPTSPPATPTAFAQAHKELADAIAAALAKFDESVGGATQPTGASTTPAAPAPAVSTTGPAASGARPPNAATPGASTPNAATPVANPPNAAAKSGRRGLGPALWGRVYAKRLA